jgi:hypothetical protein
MKSVFKTEPKDYLGLLLWGSSKAPNALLMFFLRYSLLNLFFKVKTPIDVKACIQCQFALCLGWLSWGTRIVAKAHGIRDSDPSSEHFTGHPEHLPAFILIVKTKNLFKAMRISLNKGPCRHLGYCLCYFGRNKTQRGQPVGTALSEWIR